jgi:acetyl esterase/lipase
MRGCVALTAGWVGLTAVVADPVLARAQVPAGGRYLESVFDEVEITRDVPYRETVDWRGNPDTLLLDIYEPAGDTIAKRPVILIMSGGFYAFIDKTLLFGAGETYARMGYVVVSIEYRVRPGAGLEQFPNVDPDVLQGAILDAYDDAFAAAGWIRDHAADLRIDPEAIVPVGGSAGGNIAWNLAWLQGDDLRPVPSGIRAAISTAGAPGPGTADIGDPPVLALHGTRDLIIDVSLAAEPCTAADEAGIRCDLVTYEDAGHPLDPRTQDLLRLHGADITARSAGFIAEVVLQPLGYFGEPSPPGQPGPGEPVTVPPPATPVLAQPTFTG